MEAETQQQSTNISQQTRAFEKFEAYEFESDAAFQAGIKSIVASNKDKTEKDQHEAIQNAKLFYFSRFIEPFEINQYKLWVAQKEEVPEKAESIDAIPTEDPQSQATDPSYPKSFQEICDLIAAGKPIPGIRQIPNNLAEGAPSEAKLQPRPKPWEKKPVSTASLSNANEAIN